MADKPTICIDASRVSHDVSTGTENVSASVIRALVELPEARGYRFLLYAPQRLPAGFMLCSEAEVHTRIVGTGRPWLLRFARALRGDKRVIDSLYIPSHIVPPFGLPKRTVTMIHGMEWDRAPWAYDWFERRQQAYAARHALHNCQTIITPSETTKRQLIKWAKQQDYVIPFIDVASHGVPPLPEPSESVPEELGRNLVNQFDKVISPFIVSIGRTDKRKQLDVLIEAFEQFCQESKRDDVQLMIAGPQGSGHDALVRQVNTSVYVDQIHLLGAVSNETKSWLLSHATSLVYVSAAEGFGLPILEAAQMGCSMILSDDEAIQETAQLVESHIDTIEGLSSYAVRTPHQQYQSVSRLKNAIHDMVVHMSISSSNSVINSASKDSYGQVADWNRQAQKVFKALTS